MLKLLETNKKKNVLLFGNQNFWLIYIVNEGKMKNFFLKMYIILNLNWEFVKDIVSNNDIFNIKANNSISVYYVYL